LVYDRWANQVFGFEVTNVHPVSGQLQDQLKLTVQNWNSMSDDSFLGVAYVKLSELKENEPVDMWVKLENVEKGEVKITLKRSTKTAAELDEIMNQSIFKALNKKMLYALNIVKLKLKEKGLVCSVTISVELVAISVYMTVTLGGGDETIEQIKANLGQAEQAVEEGGGIEGSVGPAGDDADAGGGADTQKAAPAGADKNFLTRAIDKMFRGLSASLQMMRANGIGGTVGASANITGSSLFYLSICFALSKQEVI
jgi:hypothetical protein